LKNTGKRARAIATTDLVSHPENCFHPVNPTLLISFARSGNSPESIAAVELANQCCAEVYHLVITCNAKGKLATCITDDCFIFLLPPEADDKALAMTGSFSAMLLTGLLITRLNDLQKLKGQVEILSMYGENLLTNYATKMKEVAKLHFSRAVFLGSGP
jgi:tagatose-6-phosphate ketose/aldose isomerase